MACLPSLFKTGGVEKLSALGVAFALNRIVTWCDDDAVSRRLFSCCCCCSAVVIFVLVTDSEFFFLSLSLFCILFCIPPHSLPIIN